MAVAKKITQPVHFTSDRFPDKHVRVITALIQPGQALMFKLPTD